METKLIFKSNNILTDMKNRFSSIFSWLFSNKKNKKLKEKNENVQLKKNNKNEENVKNNNKPCENKHLKEKEHTKESGVIPIFLIKILVAVVLIIVIVVALYTIIYSMVKDANFNKNVNTMVADIKAFFVKFFYSIAKWILCIVDIIFSYVKSLCGLNMDFTSLNGIISAESDMVFNLLITSHERASAIFRNLIVLAIIMIIIFTIIALIKTQFESMRLGRVDDKTSVMATIKKTIRAFILLLITPFLAIGGIVFSDLLLQTLYRATNTTGAVTLGGQIFSTAAVSSNAYRNYALNNMRIPIVCDVTEDEEIFKYYYNNPASDSYLNYLTSSKNMTYVTYMSFVNDDFYSFTELNEILDSNKSEFKEKAYYAIYDVASEEKRQNHIDLLNKQNTISNNTKQIINEKLGKLNSKIDPLTEEEIIEKTRLENELSLLEADISSKNTQISNISNNGNQYKIIESYSEEYFVMADLIDFAVNTGNELYMLTIEDVLDSLVIENLKDIFDDYINKYQIKFYADSSLQSQIPSSGNMTLNLYKTKSWGYLTYTSNYVSPDENGTPRNPMQIPYTHVKGETDELFGAKYIMAAKVTKQYDNGVEYSYYEPVTNNYTNRYNIAFSSEYIDNGQIIAAKGTFKNAKYPTAIRKTVGSLDSESGDNLQIVFYRDDIESVAVGSISNMFKANLGDDGNAGFFDFTKVFMMIKLFFQPDSIAGSMEFNPDAFDTSQKIEESMVNGLAGGRIKRLSYFLNYSADNPGEFAENRTLTFKEMFDPQEFNIILIFIAPLILIRVCMSAIFGLIQRAYELFLIILTYPVTCATIPYEDRAYGLWWQEYFQRLFATYGIILGINIVLMLFPIITSLSYFTPGEIATNKVLYKVSTLFFGFMTISHITALLNSIVIILFELVAFTMLDAETGVPHMIDEMVGAMGLKGGFLETLQKLQQRIRSTVKVIGKVVGTIAKFAGSKVMNVIDTVFKPESARKRRQEMKSFRRSLLPGSALLDKHQGMKKSSRATRAAMNKFGSDMAGIEYDPNSDEEPKKPNKNDKQYKNEDGTFNNAKYKEDEDKYNTAKKEWDKKQEDKKKPFQNILDAQKNELRKLDIDKAHIQGPKAVREVRKRQIEEDFQKEQEEKKRKKKEEEEEKKNDPSSTLENENRHKKGEIEGEDQDDTPEDDDTPPDESPEDSPSGDTSHDDSQSDDKPEESSSDDSSGGDGGKPKKPKHKKFNADEHGMAGLDEEMKVTNLRKAKAERKAEMLRRKLREQQARGDKKGAAETQAEIEKQERKARALENHYFDVYEAKKKREAEEAYIRKNGSKEAKEALAQKNRERDLNDKKRHADLRARGQTLGGTITSYIKKNSFKGVKRAWGKHIERRNARWERAFSNTHGNVFSKIGNAVYRKYIEKRLGSNGKKNEIARIDQELALFEERQKELDEKVKKGELTEEQKEEEYSKLNDEYARIHKLSKKRERLQSGFSKLNNFEKERYENLSKEVDEFAEYGDTDTTLGKLMAISHPIKALKAKYISNKEKRDNTEIKINTLSKEKEDIEKELKQIGEATTAPSIKRKKELEGRLEMINKVELPRLQTKLNYVDQFRGKVFERTRDNLPVSTSTRKPISSGSKPVGTKKPTTSTGVKKPTTTSTGTTSTENSKPEEAPKPPVTPPKPAEPPKPPVTPPKPAEPPKPPVTPPKPAEPPKPPVTPPKPAEPPKPPVTPPKPAEPPKPPTPPTPKQPTKPEDLRSFGEYFADEDKEGYEKYKKENADKLQGMSEKEMKEKYQSDALDESLESGDFGKGDSKYNAIAARAGDKRRCDKFGVEYRDGSYEERQQMMMAQFASAYCQADKEGYDKYLKENKMIDSEQTRIDYKNQQKKLAETDPEKKKEFNRNDMVSYGLINSDQSVEELQKEYDKEHQDK